MIENHRSGLCWEALYERARNRGDARPRSPIPPALATSKLLSPTRQTILSAQWPECLPARVHLHTRCTSHISRYKPSCVHPAPRAFNTLLRLAFVQHVNAIRAAHGIELVRDHDPCFPRRIAVFSALWVVASRRRVIDVGRAVHRRRQSQDRAGIRTRERYASALPPPGSRSQLVERRERVLVPCGVLQSIRPAWPSRPRVRCVRARSPTHARASAVDSAGSVARK